MKRSFARSVAGICREYNLDIEQVAETYQADPERLTSLYGEMAGARRRRNADTALMTFGLVAMTPVITLPVFAAASLDSYRNVRIISNVKYTVYRDIIAHEKGKRHPPKPA